MGISRACRPCRTAKTKCDRQRPTCSLCSKRKIACYGYASDSEYMFLDQNATAKVNSERSRRASKHTTNELCLFEAPTKNNTIVLSNDSLQTSLSNIPSPVLYKLQDRVLDIFYMEWVSGAYSQRRIHGYLDVLPDMKSKAAPVSALNLAVEAFALANARNLKTCNGSLAQMALSRYGAALATVRNAIKQHALTADDDTLMAILTIDMFEVVFMVREEPLRLHNEAIEYLLSARGTQQVQSVTGRAIYRMANHRLQVRQLGLGLEPLPVQLACADILDQSTPAHSLGKMQLGAQQTLAMSRDLLSCSSSGWEELLCLFFQIQVHLSEFEQWKSDLPGSWKPKRIHLAEYSDVLELLAARSVPYTQYVLIYEDPVITHRMAFFYQGQMALRSALLDTMTEMKNVCPDQYTLANLDQEIDSQCQAISHSADALVESATPLLGSIEIDENGSVSLTGNKIALCFARAVCWALQQEKRVPMEHKGFTYRVEDWIRKETDVHRLC